MRLFSLVLEHTVMFCFYRSLCVHCVIIIMLKLVIFAALTAALIIFFVDHPTATSCVICWHLCASCVVPRKLQLSTGAAVTTGQWYSAAVFWHGAWWHLCASCDELSTGAAVTTGQCSILLIQTGFCHTCFNSTNEAFTLPDCARQLLTRNVGQCPTWWSPCRI